MARNALIALLLAAPWAAAAPPDAAGRALALLVAGANGHRDELTWFESHWRPVHAAFLLDIVRFVPDQTTAGAVYELLRRKTGAKLADSWPDWMRWSWNHAPAPEGGTPNSSRGSTASLTRNSQAISPPHGAR